MAHMEIVDLAAENARLQALAARLTPLALRTLRQAHLEPGDESYELWQELEDGLKAEPKPSPLVSMMISDLSEDHWCAGWLGNCEYDLWARVLQYRRTGRCTGWGMAGGDDFFRQVAKLSEAAESTSSWAVWRKDADTPILLSEWLHAYWPNAKETYHQLAESAPRCDEYGTMKAGDKGWPYLPACQLDYGHPGEHKFTENGDND